MLKAYYLRYGNLSTLFPRSREYDNLDDIKRAVEKEMLRQRWYQGEDIVILSNDGPTLVALYRDLKWLDIPQTI
jgi:hypothetical protein